ncbi:hypothetical protein [Pseudoalteromonas lipolytica]|uniref:hypothetical protein n=1 Tax=Pseudoalteromonas lipolytica TaxID=570156 RepID=UPI003A984DA3
MPISTLFKHLLITASVSLLPACMLLQQQPEPLYTEQQIQQFAAQYQSQQQSIARLTEMENDLRIMTAELNSKPDVQMLSKASESDQTHSDNASITYNDAVARNAQAPAGAQLGVYLDPSQIKRQVLIMKKQYPGAFDKLEFVFLERPTKSQTRYALRVGPFANYNEATVFCYLAKQLQQHCLTAPFLGEPLDLSRR